MKKQKLHMGHRAAKLAARVIDWDKRAFDRAAKTVESVQDRSEKAVKRTVDDAKWIPDEGKQVVDAWIHVMRRSRRDLRKTMDTSLELSGDFFRRMGEPATRKTTSSGRKPRKSGARKRKSAERPAAIAS